MSRNNNVCRLCLQLMQGDKNFTLILNDKVKLSMLNLFKPNLNLKIAKDPKICSNCALNLQVAYNFKKTAMENEVKITSEVSNWSGGIINLKDIEVDDGIKKDLDAPTCRVCFKASSVNNIPLYDEPSYAHSFKLVRSLINSCIVEMNYDLSEKPVLCNNCWLILQSVYLFKRTLVENEDKLLTYHNGHKFKVLTNADLLKICNKTTKNSDKTAKNAQQIQNNNENIDSSNVQIKQEPCDDVGDVFTENVEIKQDGDQQTQKKKKKREPKKKKTNEKVTKAKKQYKRKPRTPKATSKKVPSKTVERPKKQRTNKIVPPIKREILALVSEPDPPVRTSTVKPIEIVNKSVLSPKAKEKERFLALFSLHTEKIIIGLRKRRITRRSKKLSFLSTCDELNEREIKRKGRRKQNNGVIAVEDDPVESIVIPPKTDNEIVPLVENLTPPTTPKKTLKTITPGSRRSTRNTVLIDENVEVQLTPSEPQGLRKSINIDEPPQLTPESDLAPTELVDKPSIIDTSLDTTTGELATNGSILTDDRCKRRKLWNKRNKKTNKTWELIKSADIPAKNKVTWKNAFKLLSDDNKKLLEKKVENVMKALINKQKALKNARRKRILRNLQRKKDIENRQKKALEQLSIKNKVELIEEPPPMPNGGALNISDYLDNQANNNVTDVSSVTVQSLQEPPKQDSSIQTDDGPTMETKVLQDPILKNMRKITDYFKKRSELDVSVVQLKQFSKPINKSALSSNNSNSALSITPFKSPSKFNAFNNSLGSNSSVDSLGFSFDLTDDSRIIGANNNEILNDRKRDDEAVKRLSSIDLTIESVVNPSFNKLSSKTTKPNIGQSSDLILKSNFNVPQTGLTSTNPPPVNIVSYVKSEIPANGTDEKKHVCNICSFRTKYKHHLFRHLLVHADREKMPQFKCPYCPYKCIKNQYLKSHMLQHDPDAVKFKCDFCSYVTNRKDRLKLHTNTHQPEKTPKIFKCPHCPYSAARKTNLQCHLVGHETEPRFNCSECEYKTKRKSHLVIHMLKHADPEMVKIYHCMNCPYKAKRKHHLQIHVLKGCKGRKEA